MKKNNLVFIILLKIAINTVVSSKTCPDSQICVPINHCSTINQMLYNENLSSNEINNLKSLQCGFKSNQVYVCCNSSLPKPGVCGSLELDNRVINGNMTNLGEYPFAVLIGRRWKENGTTGIEYECGGSIINNRYVVTAAHCVKFLDGKDFRERVSAIEAVKLGEWDLRTDIDVQGNEVGDPVVIGEVEKITYHKKYRLSHRHNDIALLRLKQKINFTKYIAPICLPNSEQQLENKLRVIGWGKSNMYSTELENIQRVATINLVENDACNAAFDRYTIESTQICAGSEGSDSCGGDSGGPLVGVSTLIGPNGSIVYNYLAGIVSFGKKTCGELGVPGVYTNVKKYLNWIQQNVIH